MSLIGGNIFVAVKSFDANIAISDNFVLNSTDSKVSVKLPTEWDPYMRSEQNNIVLSTDISMFLKENII